MKKNSSQFTFNATPILKRSRSRFDLSGKVLTSFNEGQLVPFYIQEVYPGDTFKINSTFVARTSSPLLKPIMDNLFLDQYFFYVPHRLTYDKWQNVMGENTDSAWANTKDYSVPLTSGKIYSKTVGDYLGLPLSSATNNASLSVSILPFRAFALIYDQWFRDQNNISPMHVQTGSVSVTESLVSPSAWSPLNYVSAYLPKVAKMHDYFTSCLPAPQKGESSGVDVELSNIAGNVVIGDYHDMTNSRYGTTVYFGNNASSLSSGLYNLGLGNNTTGNDRGYLIGQLASGSASTSGLSINKSNLVVSEATGTGVVGVNDLRLAFALQKMLERDARGGSRYVEYLNSHFGVVSPDARLQRTEFLGGKRSPLNVAQVTQTTGSDSDSAPLGQLGAYSLSAGQSRVTKSFVEHGFVIGVCCVRQFHTYQQGVQKFWTRSKRTDFYDPVFANIGEQPVYRSELYAGSEGVFGYNEAWADLRYRPNIVTSQMRSGATDSLDLWHLADNYSNSPTLNETFINESPILDRSLTVQSSVQDQFIVDFYVQNIAYRELPTYSVPSLIDRN